MVAVEAVGLRPGEILSADLVKQGTPKRHAIYKWEMHSFKPGDTVVVTASTPDAFIISTMIHAASARDNRFVTTGEIRRLIINEGSWISDNQSRYFSDLLINGGAEKLRQNAIGVVDKAIRSSLFEEGKRLLISRVDEAKMGRGRRKKTELPLRYQIIDPLANTANNNQSSSSEVQVWDQELTNRAIARVKDSSLRFKMKVLNEGLEDNPTFSDIVLKTAKVLGIRENEAWIVGTLLNRLMTSKVLVIKTIENVPAVDTDQPSQDQPGKSEHIFTKDQGLVSVCLLQRYFLLLEKLAFNINEGLISVFRQCRKDGYHQGAWRHSEAELLKLFAGTGFDRILQGQSAVVGVGID